MGLVLGALSLAGMNSPANAQQPGQEEHEQREHEQREGGQQRRQEDQDYRQERGHWQHGEQRNRDQRLSQQQQDQRISEQQQRVAQYRQHLDQQEAFARQRTALLLQQKRVAQYRFQEQYVERLRQQQLSLRNDRFDYARDPYFYTASTYRYNRDGRYFETNEYGATALRQAVNYGYDGGFRAGAADRDDRWRSNYKDSYGYRDANYGYSGYYVNRTDYNYYFRQGFSRGYEDGYNRRFQYGRNANGNYSMLDNVVARILNFQALR